MIMTSSLIKAATKTLVFLLQNSCRWVTELPWNESVKEG